MERDYLQMLSDLKAAGIQTVDEFISAWALKDKSFEEFMKDIHNVAQLRKEMRE